MGKDSRQKAEEKCIKLFKGSHPISKGHLPGRIVRWISSGRPQFNNSAFPRPASAGADSVAACLVASCAKSAHVSGSTSYSLLLVNAPQICRFGSAWSQHMQILTSLP